jgi:hypothetical protein
MPVEPKLGTLVDVAIRGVRVVGHPSAPLVRIADEHGVTYDMPPQAAFAPSGETRIDEYIASALRALDGMELEGYIEPYVAATVRKKLGLPPRHWPPQAGDVWSDANPFCHLWFAQLSHDDGRTDIVMAPLDGGPQGISAKTPDEFLSSSCQLALEYRNNPSRPHPNDEGDNA